jgi:membrane protein YqaA with SNARE-associated domain
MPEWLSKRWAGWLLVVVWLAVIPSVLIWLVRCG